LLESAVVYDDDVRVRQLARGADFALEPLPRLLRKRNVLAIRLYGDDAVEEGVVPL